MFCSSPQILKKYIYKSQKTWRSFLAHPFLNITNLRNTPFHNNNNFKGNNLHKNHDTNNFHKSNYTN